MKRQNNQFCRKPKKVCFNLRSKLVFKVPQFKNTFYQRPKKHAGYITRKTQNVKVEHQLKRNNAFLVLSLFTRSVKNFVRQAYFCLVKQHFEWAYKIFSAQKKIFSVHQRNKKRKKNAWRTKFFALLVNRTLVLNKSSSRKSKVIVSYFSFKTLRKRPQNQIKCKI